MVSGSAWSTDLQKIEQRRPPAADTLSFRACCGETSSLFCSAWRGLPVHQSRSCSTSVRRSNWHLLHWQNYFGVLLRRQSNGRRSREVTPLKAGKKVMFAKAFWRGKDPEFNRCCLGSRLSGGSQNHQELLHESAVGGHFSINTMVVVFPSLWPPQGRKRESWSEAALTMAPWLDGSEGRLGAESFQTSATNFEIIAAVGGKGGRSDASAKAVHTLNYFRTTPIQSSLQSKFMRTNKWLLFEATTSDCSSEVQGKTSMCTKDHVRLAYKFRESARPIRHDTQYLRTSKRNTPLPRFWQSLPKCLLGDEVILRSLSSNECSKKRWW